MLSVLITKSLPLTCEAERLFTKLRSLPLLVVPLLLQGGCASLQDWTVRQQFLDHDSQQMVLPHLLDSYQQKMTEPAPLPATSPAPVDMDRG